MKNLKRGKGFSDEFDTLYLCSMKKNSTFAQIFISCAIRKDDSIKDESQVGRRCPTTFCDDIAQASKKGRRTLYTYFKSKEQIYMAVVESELEMLSTQMEKAASKPVSPDKKILELIMTHLDAIKMVVYRNGTLRADFFRDIWRVEAMRKEFYRKETALFRRVLHEGKELNLFDIDNVEITADILHYCIKGIEVPYIRGQIGEELDDETGWRYVAKIVYGALGCKKKENNHIV